MNASNNTLGVWQKLNRKPESLVFVDDAYEVMQTNQFLLGDEGQEITSDTNFYLGFARTLEEVCKHAQAVTAITATDPAVWIAYPKASSKTYTCDFNRDTGWAELGALGYEPVRQVAINSDWSALRFRKVEYIKTMTRSFAMTELGKQKSRLTDA
jgi:hypothetical protein